MNLEQLRAKYATNNTKAETVTAATETVVETVPVLGTGWFGNTTTRTVQVAKSAATSIGGIMPATNRRVDSIASEFNSRINNVEVKQWGQDVKIEMLAQLLGANLPSDEELVAAFEAQQNQKKVEEEAIKAEAVAEAVASKMEKMMEMFASMMGKAAVIDEPVEITEDEIYEIIEEVVEEPKPKKQAKPKKEEEAPKGTGRRRVKRGAPLAE